MLQSIIISFPILFSVFCFLFFLCVCAQFHTRRHNCTRYRCCCRCLHRNAPFRKSGMKASQAEIVENKTKKTIDADFDAV